MLFDDDNAVAAVFERRGVLFASASLSPLNRNMLLNLKERAYKAYCIEFIYISYMYRAAIAAAWWFFLFAVLL